MLKHWFSPCGPGQPGSDGRSSARSATSLKRPRQECRPSLVWPDILYPCATIPKMMLQLPVDLPRVDEDSVQNSAGGGHDRFRLHGHGYLDPPAAAVCRTLRSSIEPFFPWLCQFQRCLLWGPGWRSVLPTVHPRKFGFPVRFPFWALDSDAVPFPGLAVGQLQGGMLRRPVQDATAVGTDPCNPFRESTPLATAFCTLRLLPQVERRGLHGLGLKRG